MTIITIQLLRHAYSYIHVAYSEKFYALQRIKKKLKLFIFHKLACRYELAIKHTIIFFKNHYLVHRDSNSEFLQKTTITIFDMRARPAFLPAS